jgi:hypothetical protein
MRGLEKRTGRLADWVRAMLAQRHSNVVACAPPTSWPERPGRLLRAEPHSTLATQLTRSERTQLHVYLTRSPNWICDD